MRRKLSLALAMSALLALAVVAIANAASTTLKAGNLVVTFGGSSSPKALPKNTYAPVTANIFGKIGTTDGTHPAPLRWLRVELNRNGRISTAGLATCRAVLGEPVQSILAAARRADTIVMATLGRTGLAHLVMGSIAERVVRHSPVPVLTVRPGSARRRTARARARR